MQENIFITYHKYTISSLKLQENKINTQFIKGKDMNSKFTKEMKMTQTYEKMLCIIHNNTFK